MRLVAYQTRLLLALALVAIAAPVRAQDIQTLNLAAEAYKQGKYAEASLAFFDVAENSGEPELAYRAEYFLALSLFKLGLYQSALTYDNFIIEQGPNHPYYTDAVANMLDVMDAVGDSTLIPDQLDKIYDGEAFAKLPLETINRINFLVGLRSHQKRNLVESVDFLAGVARESASYPRARYLRGVQLASTAADDAQTQAAEAFAEVLKLDSSDKVKYADLPQLKEMSTLGLARVRYAQGNFADAYDLYNRIPRFSRHWRDALFEGAYAAFQNDEYGKALGMLHTLHAPVAGDQLVPESWLLKAYIYYFSCLFDETKATLAEMDRRYAKIGEQVKALREAKREPEFYYDLLVRGGEKDGLVMPAMVRNELLTDDDLLSRRAFINSLGDELARIRTVDAWKRSNSALPEVLVEAVAQQRNILVQVAGKWIEVRGLARIELAIEDNLDAQAEIVKFEMAKREKTLLEGGHDLEAELSLQSLDRPSMPERGAEYWVFDGEFWPDELGFYRYTVKNACPAADRDPASTTAGL